MQRCTIVVHGRLIAGEVRLEAARARRHGVQVMGMPALAARLAGGFSRGVDSDTLSAAVGAVLAETPQGDLGDLEAIRGLPGLQLAVARTLGKAWRAGLDPRSWSTASAERSPAAPTRAPTRWRWASSDLPGGAPRRRVRR